MKLYSAYKVQKQKYDDLVLINTIGVELNLFRKGSQYSPRINTTAKKYGFFYISNVGSPVHILPSSYIYICNEYEKNDKLEKFLADGEFKLFDPEMKEGEIFYLGNLNGDLDIRVSFQNPSQTQSGRIHIERYQETNEEESYSTACPELSLAIQAYNNLKKNLGTQSFLDYSLTHGARVLSSFYSYSSHLFESKGKI